MPSQPRLLPALCLALVLSVAPAALCAFVIVGGVGAYAELQVKRQQKGPAIYRTWERLVVDPSGRALIRVDGPRTGEVRFLDAGHRPAEVADKNAPWLAECRLPARRRSELLVGPPVRWQPAPVVNVNIPGEDWYFVVNDPDGHGHFEGYRVETRERIGSIGTGGFVPGSPPADERFAVNGRLLALHPRLLLTGADFRYRVEELRQKLVAFAGGDPLLAREAALLAGERLLLVDFENRTLRDLLPGIPVQSIDIAERLQRRPADADPDPQRDTLPGARFEASLFLAARTDDRIILLNPAQGTREEYPLPADWGERDVEMYLPAGMPAVFASFVHGSDRVIVPGRNRLELDLLRIWADGDTPNEAPTGQERIVIEHPAVIAPATERGVKNVLVAAIPAPLVSAVVAWTWIPRVESILQDRPIAELRSRAIAQVWPALLAVTLLAAGLTWLAERRLRDCGLPRSYAWLAFVFLLGLPGYIAWRVHRRWPIRKPAAPPMRTGVEIFA